MEPSWSQMQPIDGNLIEVANIKKTLFVFLQFFCVSFCSTIKIQLPKKVPQADQTSYLLKIVITLMQCMINQFLIQFKSIL